MVVKQTAPVVVFIFLICFIQAALCQNSYSEEPFSFLSGGLQLDGTLTIPASFEPDDKLVVLLTAPQAIQRDYHGMFSSLADTLGKRGVAVFRFDNRAYTDTSLAKDAVTVHEQARDVLKAVEALGEDPRFSKSPVGLLGHSEGGSAAAIAVSEDKNVAFAIFLASSGINGEELAYYQGTTAINGLPVPLPEEQKKRIFEGLRENIRIVAKYPERDSVEYYMDRFLRWRYTLLGTAAYGKQTMEEAVAGNKKRWLKPRLMAYIRFKPKLYYSKVSCPALVMYGKLDEQLDYRSNSEGIRKIFTETQKQNYKIVALDSLDHAFKPYTRSWNPFHQKKPEKPVNPKDFSRQAWGIIVNWIADLKLQ